MVVENHSNSKNIIKYSQKHSNNLHHEPIRPQSTILKFIQREPLLNEVTQTSKSSDCEVEYAIPTSFPIEIQNKNQIATQNFKCKKEVVAITVNAEKWVIIVIQMVPVLTLIAKI
jgi:hypothetical protein